MKTISFIGAGNVAWHLAQGLKNVGYQVGSIWSRDPRHAYELCSITEGQPAASIQDLHPGTEMIIVSVKDDAVRGLLDELPNYDGLIVHTSGSLGLDVFGQRFNHPGVMYPFQTFTRKVELNLGKIPFLIEARQPLDLEATREVASALSTSVLVSDETQRRIIHVAGVFACNFTNYFYTLARELLRENGFDYELLKPIIEETTRKALFNNPEDVQTGPARRNDYSIIEKHLEMLKPHPELAELYEIVSEKIMKKYKIKQDQ